MRLRVDFGYDGTDFSGWAAQPGRRTVEDELAKAWATILRADAPKLTVAGRTDAGVHARGSVCHLDVDEELLAKLPGRSDRDPVDAAVTRLNGVLPDDVVVHSVSLARPGFDARFSASSRRYLYRIADADAFRDPLRRRDTVWIKSPLDLDAMDEAAAKLLGSTTSPPSARSAKVPPPSGRCCATTGRALLTVCSKALSSRTPSATRWCVPWSVRSSRSGRGGVLSTGPHRC